jgi:hypothetical protein
MLSEHIIQFALEGWTIADLYSLKKEIVSPFLNFSELFYDFRTLLSFSEL